MSAEKKKGTLFAAHKGCCPGCSGYRRCGVRLPVVWFEKMWCFAWVRVSWFEQTA